MVIRNLMVALLLLIMITTNALAHSWYDVDCCSGNDCSPITWMEQKGSVITFKTELFKDEVFKVDMAKLPSHHIRPSKDAKMHACVIHTLSYAEGYYVRCLYVGGGA
jgi:hypothetical protein